MVGGEQDDWAGDTGRDSGREGGCDRGRTLRRKLGGDPAPLVNQALRLRR